MMAVISGIPRLSASFQDDGKDRKGIRVCDCRFDHRDSSEKVLKTSGLAFNDFLRVVRKEFAIPSVEKFVLTTTDRTVLDVGGFGELQDGTTLLLLQKVDQVLPGAREEHIMFLPHYDTLVRSGMYEYYASEGKNPLPYTIAELIDNALSATARNIGVRTIEIRMMFDETLGKPAVIVLDNGCGMTSKQLNNWAVYRLSKFSRENAKCKSEQEGYVRPDPVPRSLNSDISYFGVGGKQAVFYIGDSVRMITKAASSPDVHELVISKEEFERKERINEDIYSGIIRNRKSGDFSHINQEDVQFLRDLIAEEAGKESFTAVVITGVVPLHVTYLKQDFHMWTRQLAHTYHYYIHGVNGRDLRINSTNSDGLPKIDIQILLREKPPKCPCVLNLRNVNNDMQTLYISAAADTFEFRAFTAQDGTVEGILRYHPFLYDKETYPEDPDAVQESLVDDDDYNNEAGVLYQTRGSKSIFECFWNGRLIPYTAVSAFDWCARPSKAAKVPLECYSRFSGVLFTDDKFQVSTNKLTFMDLDLQLNRKDTIFTRIVNGQKQRSNIQRDFTQWLNTCHEKCDKQVKFLGFNGTIMRTDVPAKKMQHPWATFSSIEWDGKIYKKGQHVKSWKTQPIFCGTVLKFLLYGDHDGDVFATGGQVEVALEPKALYNQTKIIAITKIDKTATVDAIEKSIENDLAKLPEKLTVGWPEGNPWPMNAARPAGTLLGPLQVEILNKKGESISRMPSVGQGTVKKLMIELKIVWHGPEGDEEITSHIAQHSPKWGFWFKSIDHLTNLGMYTLWLNTVINESDKQLPNFRLKFKITEGNAERFIVGEVSSALLVGVPFDIPLELMDAHGHRALPPPDLKPVFECSGLDLSYEGVDCRGTIFTIRSVKAKGKVQYQCKPYDLKVILPGLKQDSQTFRITLLPGIPHSLHVMPEATPITVENGTPARFNVEIHDEVGNITAHPKLIVRCQVQGLPPAVIDCSSTGAGHLETKPINLKIIKGESYKVRATFDMPSQKAVAVIVRELRVVPSTKVFRLEVYCRDDENLVLRNKEKIEWEAGGLLENLYFKLYDEGNREIHLTAEIASMIQVLTGQQM
ncbi:hypothetical protein LDENG_00105580 [Lucifuga dentata]|nr:hypothetical protein LDENG_00105580 [Lucifuga dentata]